MTHHTLRNPMYGYMKNQPLQGVTLRVTSRGFDTGRIRPVYFLLCMVIVQRFMATDMMTTKRGSDCSSDAVVNKKPRVSSDESSIAAKELVSVFFFWGGGGVCSL